jgi:hypothetical protein
MSLRDNPEYETYIRNALDRSFADELTRVMESLAPGPWVVSRPVTTGRPTPDEPFGLGHEFGKRCWVYPLPVPQTPVPAPVYMRIDRTWYDV